MDRSHKAAQRKRTPHPLVRVVYGEQERTRPRNTYATPQTRPISIRPRIPFHREYRRGTHVHPTVRVIGRPQDPPVEGTLTPAGQVQRPHRGQPVAKPAGRKREARFSLIGKQHCHDRARAHLRDRGNQ